MGVVAESLPDLTPIGAAWLRCWSGDQKGYGYVDDDTPELSIALLPGNRGHGIGTRLMEAALAAARKRYAAVSLSVAPDNAARRWYERLGFEFVGTNGDSWVMQLVFDQT